MNCSRNAIKNSSPWVHVTDFLLTPDWRQALSKYPVLYVGFSGGLDSSVLLHCLAGEPALFGKLKAVYVHHGLSENASDWQEHCQRVCDTLAIPFIARHVVLGGQSNIEEEARVARYQAFATLLSEDDGLLLAHHKDDQAETLLLQLFRGAGIDGMAAMGETKKLPKGTLLRPFLNHSRETLEAYARGHQLTWVEDESNQNSAFSRNHLRHHIMPFLKEKWPNVIHQLSQSASHCQDAKANLEALAAVDANALGLTSPQLVVWPLQQLESARLRNVLRAWFKNNNVRAPSASILNQLINDVILARKDAFPLVEWSGVGVRRYQNTLYLLKNTVRPRMHCLPWLRFPEPLVWGESGLSLHAIPSDKGLRLVNGQRIEVRCRKGGEQFFWRRQHKDLKKLLQQWQVPPWQRDEVPLLYIDNQLAAVVGFAVSDDHYSEHCDNTYEIIAR